MILVRQNYLLPYKLTDIRHAQPDAIIAWARAHYGELLAIWQDQLVVDKRLAPSYGQLLVAQAIL
jgi:hypothetical protein